MNALFAPLIMGFKIMGHNTEAISPNRRFSKATFCFFLLGTYLSISFLYRIISSATLFSYRMALLIHGTLGCLSYLSIVFNLKGMVNITKKLEILRGKQEYKPDLKIHRKRLFWISIFNITLVTITLINSWRLGMQNDSFNSLAATYLHYTGEVMQLESVITKIMIISTLFVSQVIPSFTLLFHAAICIGIRSVCKGFQKSLRGGEKDLQDLGKLQAFYNELIRTISDYNDKMKITMFLMYIGFCLKCLRALQGFLFVFNLESIFYNGPLLLNAIISLLIIIFPADEVHNALAEIFDSVSCMKFRNVSFLYKSLFILKIQNYTTSLTIWNFDKINKNLFVKTFGMVMSYSVVFYEIDKASPKNKLEISVAM
ncbi:uncharacterized protein NPIL_143951 [Nephila pilipes]|uniref:Gustatory receptor n=1 Tax=Nephila pilipes TaxID=299642 RepID=A0A8X6T1A7_NEPPI|nr:uncharacterized protein NPIL_143951 [Nephila pilipes]